MDKNKMTNCEKGEEMSSKVSTNMSPLFKEKQQITNNLMKSYFMYSDYEDMQTETCCRLFEFRLEETLDGASFFSIIRN